MGKKKEGGREKFAHYHSFPQRADNALTLHNYYYDVLQPLRSNTEQPATGNGSDSPHLSKMMTVVSIYIPTCIIGVYIGL